MRDPLRVVSDDQRRASQLRRRSLRAIHHLQRAELCPVGLTSLELRDEAVEHSADHLLDHLRLLRQYVLQLKASA